MKKIQFREQVLAELDSKVKLATINAREWVIKMIYDDFLDPIIRETTLNFSDPDYTVQLQNSIIKLLNSLIYGFNNYSKHLKNEVRSFLQDITQPSHLVPDDFLMEFELSNLKLSSYGALPRNLG